MSRLLIAGTKRIGKIFGRIFSESPIEAITEENFLELLQEMQGEIGHPKKKASLDARFVED